MKKTVLFPVLLFVFTCLFSGSCKEDTPLSCGERLQGTWRATSITLNGDEWLGATKHISMMEIEMNDFSTVDSEGDVRITFQINGQPPANPIVGIYKPNATCSRVTMPDFWAYPQSTFNLNIEKLDEDVLQLRINYSGSGSTSTDGNLVFDLDKIN